MGSYFKSVREKRLLKGNQGLSRPTMKEDTRNDLFSLFTLEN